MRFRDAALVRGLIVGRCTTRSPPPGSRVVAAPPRRLRRSAQRGQHHVSFYLPSSAASPSLALAGTRNFLRPTEVSGADDGCAARVWAQPLDLSSPKRRPGSSSSTSMQRMNGWSMNG